MSLLSSSVISLLSSSVMSSLSSSVMSLSIGVMSLLFYWQVVKQKLQRLQMILLK